MAKYRPRPSPVKGVGKDRKVPGAKDEEFEDVPGTKFLKRLKIDKGRKGVKPFGSR